MQHLLLSHFFKLSANKKIIPIANQNNAFIQFFDWKASNIATPKKSRKIVKFVPILIFFIS